MNHNFKKLQYWQKARMFVLDVYSATASFPREEQFCLTDQIRRASISIPSNIAEGCGRRSDRQLSHFLDIAQGSSMELETQLILASDLRYISGKQFGILEHQLHELQKMNVGLKNRLTAKF